MSSPEQGNVVQQYSCRCGNIVINAYDSSRPGPSTRSQSDYHRVFVSEDGIQITHHYLTLRTRNPVQESKTSPGKLAQHLALSCLACKTLAYRVAQEFFPGAEAREGPVIPTEDWVEQETLRSKNGWVEVFVGSGGCLVGKPAIEQHFRSVQFSRTFSIGVLSEPAPPASLSIASSPISQPWPASSTDNTVNPTIPNQILPSLPPLLPPPPFTPSHPVFVSLSAHAVAKSAELRLHAEEETKSFVKSKLEALAKEEAQLRRDVEGIWRGFREGWKEVLDRVNEERERSVNIKSQGSAPTASAKSGVPMSIRDFSPIALSHPPAAHSYHTLPQTTLPSASLLSASLVETGTHLPAAAPQSPSLGMTTSTHVTHTSSSSVHDSSLTLSSHVNGTRPSDPSSSLSPKAHGNVRLPGAFKRNMDTNIDIASSVAWAQGEEELRRRFGGEEDGEPRDRARKRTSKNLGIGAVEKKPDTNVTFSTQESTHPASTGDPPESEQRSSNDVATRPVSKATVETRKSPTKGQISSAPPGNSDVNGVTKRSKRRVTFDVQPEVSVPHRLTTEQLKKSADEVELFDLDDLSSTEPFPESDLLRPFKPARPQPVTRTPSYKLRPNDSASASRVSQPASLPAPRAMPLRLPVNGNTGWASSSVKRSVGLADALPLLSSSVPAGDRVLAKRTLERQRNRSPRTPSPPPNGSGSTSQAYMAPYTEEGRTPSPAPPSISSVATEPAEAELKHLLAAGVPSHRHAWKEGGKAWEMFRQRSQDKRRAKGAIAEEGSEGTPSSLDEASDESSDDSTIHGPWRNPSHFAKSLPVQIRPLAQYQRPLQPKTSLADKQGVLVPPLKVTNSMSNSAIRKAVYAERDRTRSIDPGPTLDFGEQEEIEEDDIPEKTSEGERGRRHALSILQARSVVPEAGMWRSMAS